MDIALLRDILIIFGIISGFIFLLTALILLLIIFISSNLLADTPYYINFKFILNQSDAGKKAQNYLKKKLENGIKNLNTKEKKIQDEEKKIIKQKKIISKEE